jgi:hypothetical protein
MQACGQGSGKLAVSPVLGGQAQVEGQGKKAEANLAKQMPRPLPKAKAGDAESKKTCGQTKGRQQDGAQAQNAAGGPSRLGGMQPGSDASVRPATADGRSKNCLPAGNSKRRSGADVGHDRGPGLASSVNLPVGIRGY